jgi:hypothetical protein
MYLSLERSDRAGHVSLHVSPTRRGVSTIRRIETGIRRRPIDDPHGGAGGHVESSGNGNKINLLEMIRRSPLAFRCYALYMYYVGEILLVAETEHMWCG